MQVRDAGWVGCCAVVPFATSVACGQPTDTTLASTTPAETWTAPRTPWGEPDLQGVDVTSNIADTWFDRVGNFHGGQMRVTERWTRTGPDHLRYQCIVV